MPSNSKSKSPARDLAALLPQRLSEALLRERIIPHFVDSYVVEHGRHSLQVHAVLYRDLLNLLQREALLTVTARVIEIITRGLQTEDDRKAKPMTRQEASAFRQKFLAGLTRHHRWNVSDALDFQSDLKMYEDLVARAASSRRPRKSFEPANHPFVDRCAFVLDSSFLEKARVAASRTLAKLESLAANEVQSTLKK
ncbi:MAG TPA: hypothetical protein VNI81_05460 [Candidatus Limnocylindrales bacterium]|nr:hypothetical protein [Candidatus Limnocylindrales bacterium]